MSSSPYKDLAHNEIHKILSMMSANSQHPYHADKTRILSQDLEFSDGWRHLVFENFTILPYRYDQYLMKNREIHSLRYSPDPYHDNEFEVLSIQITDEDCDDYMNFYLQCLLTDGEKLQPVNHVDEMRWLDDPGPAARQSLEQELRQYPQIKNLSDIIEIKKVCRFKTAIMEITFHVTKTGKVKIESERVLVDDLPVK